MKFITENDLRDLNRKEPFTTYELEPGARLTPGARQFLSDLRINMVDSDPCTNKNSINVYYFFRNKETFDRIRKLIFPEFKKKETVYIWSAGCAAGEEPYSITILLKEENITNYKIFATDIDTEAIKKAKEGIYTIDKFIETPEYIIKNYFNKINSGFKILETLKNNVIFLIHDIIKEPPLNSFDLVLCRNVVIYFIKEKQIKVFENLYKSLKRGGCLVLGKTEFLPMEFYDKFEYIDKKERILRKV